MYVCVWCEDQNRGIGKNNQLPWKIKQELQYFQKLTANHTVVMGKNTFASLPKLLPNRHNVIISQTLTPEAVAASAPKENSTSWEITNLTSFTNQFDNADQIIFIIGGKQLYEHFLAKSSYLLVSKLSKNYDCDTIMTNSYEGFLLLAIFTMPHFQVFVYKKMEFTEL